jgi:hypothetical protein
VLARADRSFLAQPDDGRYTHLSWGAWVYAFSMHHNTFNADFFFVAATIIPVLFLAITLQGKTFEGLLERWKNTFLSHATVVAEKWKDLDLSEKTDDEISDEVERDFNSIFPSRAASLTIVALSIGILIMLMAGLAGEIVAILALYTKDTRTGTEVFVLVAQLMLVTIVAAVPIGRFFRIIFRSVFLLFMVVEIARAELLFHATFKEVFKVMGQAREPLRKEILKAIRQNTEASFKEILKAIRQSGKASSKEIAEAVAQSNLTFVRKLFRELRKSDEALYRSALEAIGRSDKDLETLRQNDEALYKEVLEVIGQNNEASETSASPATEKESP